MVYFASTVGWLRVASMIQRVAKLSLGFGLFLLCCSANVTPQEKNPGDQSKWMFVIATPGQSAKYWPFPTSPVIEGNGSLNYPLSKSVGESSQRWVSIQLRYRWEGEAVRVRVWAFYFGGDASRSPDMPIGDYLVTPDERLELPEMGRFGLQPIDIRIENAPQDWGQSVDDVQISLYLASEKPAASGLPKIDLAIRNAGSGWKKIRLGEGCQPATTPGFKTTIVTLVITDLQSLSQTLKDIPGPPLSPGCAGAIGTFAVDVNSGQTTSVPLDLECYYILNWDNNALHYAWAGSGTFFLRAELGKLKSNDLQVVFSKDVPSHRCFENGLVIPCSDSR